MSSGTSDDLDKYIAPRSPLGVKNLSDAVGMASLVMIMFMPGIVTAPSVQGQAHASMNIASGMTMS